MVDEMTIAEYHEYQRTGNLPPRFRKPQRSEVVHQIAERDRDLDKEIARLRSPKAWRVVLTGRVISKKNSRRIVQFNGKPVPIASKAYKEWVSDATNQLHGLTPPVPLSGDLKITITFAMKGKGRTDMDNMLASICDLLEDAGVVDNDDSIVTAVLHKHRGADEYRTEVIVEEV